MTSEAIETAIGRAMTAELSEDDVQAIPDDLATHFGLDGLPLADRSVSLVVDDDLVLTLTYVPGLPALAVAVPVGEASKARGTPLLQRLLEANMAVQITRGGTFAMLPNGQIQLCRHILLGDRDVVRIDQELSAFAADAETWIEQIELYADSFEMPQEPHRAPADARPPPGSSV